MLKDEIEKLIHRGYLQDYINARRPRPQNEAPEAEPPHKIRTIFSGPHRWRDTWGPRTICSRNKIEAATNVHTVNKWPAKQCKGEDDDITFKESNAHLIHHPHCDTLVVKAMMVNTNVYRILVDNRSSINILY